MTDTVLVFGGWLLLLLSFLGANRLLHTVGSKRWAQSWGIDMLIFTFMMVSFLALCLLSGGIILAAVYVFQA